ncbi:hypothetical protein [Actinokineospora globicatena]|uniref:Uncharacterized protein n=1 Tax=Actinokineospora globicatena TaxID=103729 RepID=A0A9W6QMY6_9PSEU|nr:hypothetical protein [Actinokineospora globicatena]GLW91507.1 hypothetical protein Aglo03_23230 [Actinokineospora globicatena]
MVVGHPDFQPDLTATEVHETLRVINSHLSRVEIITYQQLLDRAGRVLDLVGKPEGEPTRSGGLPLPAEDQLQPDVEPQPSHR